MGPRGGTWSRLCLTFIPRPCVLEREMNGGGNTCERAAITLGCNTRVVHEPGFYSTALLAGPLWERVHCALGSGSHHDITCGRRAVSRTFSDVFLEDASVFTASNCIACSCRTPALTVLYRRVGAYALRFLNSGRNPVSRQGPLITCL